MIRLDKLLADNGLGSRKEVRKIITQGRLFLNGNPCTNVAQKIQIEKDCLTIDGSVFQPRLFIYLMLNKPAGIISSTKDDLHATVIDLLKEPWAKMELFPVGRLDLDTEGLILLTNDGILTHQITSPKKGVAKTYFVRLKEEVNSQTFKSYVTAFQNGVRLHTGYTCLPAQLCIDPAAQEQFMQTDSVSTMHITITEGKFHQVKKMFSSVGNEVVYLKRLSMGTLELDPSLGLGEYRELYEEEVRSLKELF